MKLHQKLPKTHPHLEAAKFGPGVSILKYVKA